MIFSRVKVRLLELGKRGGKMQLLVLFLVAWGASASLLDDYKQETESLYEDFAAGLDEAVPLHVALGIDSTEESKRLERDLKEELKKHIKDAFDSLMEKVNNKANNGEEINQEALKALKDLHEKMEDLQITSEEVKDGIEHLKDHINDRLKEILKKMGILEKRSMQPTEMHGISDVIGDLNLRNMLIKLKEMILTKVGADTVKNSLAKVIGQATQSLCGWLTTKSKEKVLNLFDNLLLEDEVDKRKRAVDDGVQVVKDFLDNVQEDVESKLKRFRDWLGELVNGGLSKSKKRIEKAREVLKKIISQSKDKSRKTLTSILDHLETYGKDFGLFFDDIRAMVYQLLKQKV